MCSSPPQSPENSQPGERPFKLVHRSASEAVDGFLNSYSSLIYSVLSRMCGLPEASLSDAFLYVFSRLVEKDCSRLRGWQGDSTLPTFLLAETISLGREYRDQLYGCGKESEKKAGCHKGHLNGCEPVQAEGELLIRRMEQALEEMTASLDEECQNIIHLKFKKAVSYKEAALASGIPLNSVENRFHRCLETLARRMKTRFPDLFEDRFGFDM